MTRRFAVLALALLTGCPPPHLPAVPRSLQGDVAQTLEAAGRAFSSRPDVEQVRRALGLFEASAAAEPSRVDAQAGVVRTSAWLLEAGATDDRRALADRAVAAGEACPSAAQPACTYWLAVALGLRARERQSLQDVKAVVDLLKAAESTVPGIDDAGPARVLALLLVRAPGFPLGPGDPDTALEWARKAVERSPGHPLNLLALGEALVATGDPPGAVQAYTRAREAGKARGDADGLSWARQAEQALVGLQ